MSENKLDRNRIIMVDPNISNNGLVPHEDLCIVVDLETTKRDRSSISINNGIGQIIQGNSNKLSINFLSGSEKNGKRILTTDYTNIGNNYKNITTTFNKKGDDLEGLGITNIDISFNSSFAPLIKINFVDIRGSSILEQGNDSKYNVFFNLPYPIFKLTIKGYYGNAVTYCLHLMKWNAKFNSKTGNFEIQCDFIGYTYAFLCDMLIGYLRAATETKKGKELLSGKKSSDGSDIISLNDFIKKINLLNEYINKIKTSNDTIKSLAITEDSILKLDRVKNFINNTVLDVVDDNKIYYKNDIYILYPNNYNDIVDTISSNQELLKNYVIDVNNNLDESIKLQLNSFDNINLFSGQVSGFINSKKNDIINKIGELNYSDIKLFLDNKILSNDLTNNSKIIILNVYTSILEIDKNIENLNTIKDSYKEIVSSEISSNIQNDLGFKPSIKNIIEIFTTHVDIFMELIKGVSIDASNPGNTQNRLDKFKKILNNLDKNNPINLIYPFPGYSEDGEESWIGKKINDIPEVKLVNDLLDGFLASTKVDNELNSTLINGKTLWYPVGVFDTPIFNKENQYLSLNNRGASKKTLLDLIIKRAFIFLHYTNSRIKSNELTTMAKIEANSVNDYMGDLLKLSLNGTSGSTIEDKVNNILVQYSIDNKEFSLKTLKDLNSDDSRDKYVLDSNIGINLYSTGKYLPDTQNIDDSIKYIEILDENEFNSINGSYPIYDGVTDTYSGRNTILDLRTDFRNNNLSVDNYTNNISNEYDYFNGKYKIQDFLDIKWYSDVTTDTIFWNSLGRTFLNGFFGESLNDSIYNTFTSDSSDIYRVINNYKNNEIDYINRKYITYSSNDSIYDLFTSEFYFRQSDILLNTVNISDGNYIANRSRALLFLHSLPFDGFDKGEFIGLLNGTSRLSLFNKRGGFIKLPKMYLLLLGGLLWRYDYDGDDPIIFNIYNGSNIDLPGKDEYLRTIFPQISFNGPSPSGIILKDGEYPKIESFILSLPTSARNTLKNYFNDWVDGKLTGINWGDIRKFYEIENLDFTSKSEYENRIILRGSIANQLIQLTNDNFIYEDEINVNNSNSTKLILNNNGYYNLDIYESITPLNKESISNGYLNFMGTYSDVNKLSDTFRDKSIEIMSAILEPVILANFTWRIWGDKESIDEYTWSYTNNLSVDSKELKNYLSIFLTELTDKLNNGNLINEEKLKQEAFGSINNDFIKLNIYRTIKSIYDKWVNGSNLTSSNLVSCIGDDKELFNSFRFIDKSFKDIGDDFIINPNVIVNELQNNQNQSFYDLIGRILVNNNFDFIALPTFIDYRDKSQLEEMFKPKPYISYQSDDVIGPSFICMYIGQASRNLDLSDNNELKNDGVNFDVNVGTLDSESFGGDGYTVPVFGVNFAQGNQSIFKDIQLDQSEFSETDESLRIIDEISLQGDNKNRTPAGQNLFNVFSTRSYQTEVESLGNAMIQPMMYFQLNNIPMFRGGYLITRVNHSIKPNHMTTKFRGVRVNKIMTPLIKESELYMNLLGSLSDVDINNVKLINPIDDNYLESGNIDNETRDIIYNDGSGFGDPIIGDIIITSLFGATSGRVKPHSGIDIGGIQGETKIISIYDGRITKIKIQERGYGLYLYIKHNSLGDIIYRSEYGHLADLSERILNLIKPQLSETASLKTLTSIQDLTNDNIAINNLLNGINTDIVVTKGEVIGLMGGKVGDYRSKLYKDSDTFVNLIGTSTGTHLHLTIRDVTNSNNIVVVNPELIISSGNEGRMKYAGKPYIPKDVLDIDN